MCVRFDDKNIGVYNIVKTFTGLFVYISIPPLFGNLWQLVINSIQGRTPPSFPVKLYKQCSSIYRKSNPQFMFVIQNVKCCFRLFSPLTNRRVSYSTNWDKLSKSQFLIYRNFFKCSLHPRSIWERSVVNW